MWSVSLCLVVSACLASGITVPSPPRQRLQQVARLQNPAPPVYRVRSVPVKRIYVPMKVIPRYPPLPPAAYKRTAPPRQWKQKPIFPLYGPQNFIPPRKARNPKPKFGPKPGFKYSPKVVEHAYDNYKPQTYNNSPFRVDNYGFQKQYKTGSNYKKPPPSMALDPSKTKDEAPTSYVNFYQGDKAKEDGKPTYGFTQTHSYEKKHKVNIYDNESALANHRPVYKHKPAESTSSTTEGSFQPPKQTFGFQPYEENQRESSSESFSQYYKKQPDSVLSPNYFEQSKS